MRHFLILALLVLFISGCGPDENTQSGHNFIPAETDEVLTNPHIGFEYFNHYGIYPGRIYPECSMAYYRWYWKDFEPESNQIQFAAIDQLLELIEISNMTMSFRLMTAGSYDYDSGSQLPDWLSNLGIPGTWYGENGAEDCFMPDFENPTFMSNVRRVIYAFGDKYNGDPRISHVDIGWIGHWGEWHILTEAVAKGASMPDWEYRRQYIDWTFDAFPDTPVIMMINDTNGMAMVCVSNDGGWRGDSYGDSKPGWNHMSNMYPQHVSEAGAEDAWKHAPVCMEIWGVLSNWLTLGWDAEAIFNRGIEEFHVSVVNAKSSSIPIELMDEVNAFLKRLGYRFVLKQLTLPEVITNGQTISVTALWENKGCAPAYHSYQIKYKLSDSDGTSVIQWNSSADVTGYLPGTHTQSDNFTVNISPGTYTLSVGMFWQNTPVQLAIQGFDTNGCYQLGTLIIN